ncbi:MAG: hypothetical protein ACXWLG_08245 [Myxococcaceae bacterium]
MLVVLGLLFSLMGSTLAVATAWVLMDKRGATAAVLVFLGLCLFLAIAGYGIFLVHRGCGAGHGSAGWIARRRASNVPWRTCARSLA